MNKNDTGQIAYKRPRFLYSYTTLVAALIINIVTMGMYLSIGIFFKPILNEFGWSRTVTSGPIALSWVMSGLFGILMGGLNDKLGPRVVVSICSLLLGSGYLLMSRVSNTWELYIYYGLLIGAGASIPVPLMSTVSRWFVKRRSVMIGIYMLGSAIGGLIVPPLANWLIINYSWRLSFIVLGSILLVIALAGSQFLRRDRLPITADSCCIDQASKEKRDVSTGGLSTRVALKTRQFWLIFALFFCFTLGSYVVIVHLVPHITDLGISSTVAANTLVILNGAGIAGRIGLGGLGDRLGNKPVFMITFVLYAVSFLGLIFIRQSGWFYLITIIFGLGFGSGLTQESPLVASMFGLRSHGSIFGWACLGHSLGAAAGTFLGGYLFDLSGSYQLAFIICVLTGIADISLALALKPAGITGKKSAGYD